MQLGLAGLELPSRPPKGKAKVLRTFNLYTGRHFGLVDVGGVRVSVPFDWPPNEKQIAREGAKIVATNAQPLWDEIQRYRPPGKGKDAWRNYALWVLNRLPWKVERRDTRGGGPVLRRVGGEDRTRELEQYDPAELTHYRKGKRRPVPTEAKAEDELLEALRDGRPRSLSALSLELYGATVAELPADEKTRLANAANMLASMGAVSFTQPADTPGDTFLLWADLYTLPFGRKWNFRREAWSSGTFDRAIQVTQRVGSHYYPDKQKHLEEIMDEAWQAGVLDKPTTARQRKQVGEGLRRVVSPRALEALGVESGRPLYGDYVRYKRGKHGIGVVRHVYRIKGKLRAEILAPPEPGHALGVTTRALSELKPASVAEAKAALEAIGPENSRRYYLTPEKRRPWTDAEWQDRTPEVFG